LFLFHIPTAAINVDTLCNKALHRHGFGHVSPPYAFAEKHGSTRAMEFDSPIPVEPTPTTDVQPAIAAQLAELASALKETNQIAATREAHFAQIHRELQQVRSEEAGRAFLPLFRDLIGLYDQLQAAGINDFADSVRDILERYGVEMYEPVVGEAFVPRTQRGLKAVASNDPAQDRMVARVVRHGFLFNSNVLRSADVEVFRYHPAEQTEA
jgi:molecular chaperone GrpE (heat shock protein)